MKKSIEYNPKKEWKNILDYNEDEELLIYYFLCREKGLLRFKLRKLNETLRFRSYKSWKRYINDKYRDKVHYLDEFIRFLKHERSNVSFTHNIFYAILMPIVASLFTYISFENNFLEQLIDLVTNIMNQENIGVILKNLAIVIPAFLYILFIIFYLAYTVIKLIGCQEVKKTFFDDYIEILEEMIKHNELVLGTDGNNDIDE